MVEHAQHRVSTALRHKDPLWTKYELGSRIGQGTFGQVHRGYRKDSMAPVALKFVHMDAQGDEFDKAHREVHLLTKLHHVSIIPLLEYFPPVPSLKRVEGILVFRRGRGICGGSSSGEGLIQPAQVSRASVPPRGLRWRASASNRGLASYSAGWPSFTLKASCIVI